MDGGTHPITQERGRTAEGAIDPDQIAAEIEAKGRAWADMRATAKLAELQIPLVRATAIQQLLDGGKTASGRKITRRDAEELVLMDPDFQLAQEAAIDRRFKANVAEAEFKAVQARFEAMRTAEATRRAEMTSFQR